MVLVGDGHGWTELLNQAHVLNAIAAVSILVLLLFLPQNYIAAATMLFPAIYRYFGFNKDWVFFLSFFHLARVYYLVQFSLEFVHLISALPDLLFLMYLY